MAGGNAIRGSRVGAGPMGETERGETAPRRRVSFWCANGHESRPSFAADAQIPDEWECPRCGYPTNRDRDNPPAPPKVEPYKTHLAYVRERRDDQDGEAILNEALEALRTQRGVAVDNGVAKRANFATLPECDDPLCRQNCASARSPSEMCSPLG